MDQFTRRLMGLASTTAAWVDWCCAGCFIERFAATVCQDTSARIMIRCIDSTNGKPIFGYWRLPISRRFLTTTLRVIWRDYNRRADMESVEAIVIFGRSTKQAI